MFGEIVLNFWYNSGIPPYLNGEAMFFEPEVSLGVFVERGVEMTLQICFTWGVEVIVEIWFVWGVEVIVEIRFTWHLLSIFIEVG